ISRPGGGRPPPTPWGSRAPGAPTARRSARGPGSSGAGGGRCPARRLRGTLACAAGRSLPRGKSARLPGIAPPGGRCGSRSDIVGYWRVWPAYRPAPFPGRATRRMGRLRTWSWTPLRHNARRDLPVQTGQRMVRVAQREDALAREHHQLIRVGQHGSYLAVVRLLDACLHLGGIEDCRRLVDDEDHARYPELARHGDGDARALVVLAVGTHDDRQRVGHGDGE